MVLKCSKHSHIGHIAPSLVVSVWSIRVLIIVRSLDGKLWVIWMMRVEFDLTLHGCEVLTVDLVGEVPEDTLPDEVGLTILQSQQVFIISSL